MKKGIPIIFIHKGYSWYLNYTFSQSLKNNPQSSHFILGDKHVNKFINAEFIDIEKYKTEVDQFALNYKHLSSNDQNLELFCFERWFYLKALMKEYGLSTIFTCDSDVMLYCNISEEAKKIKGEAFCIPLDQANNKLSASAHVSFWTYEGISKFCDFILSAYSSSFPQEINSKWNQMKSQGLLGGISDMAFLFLFTKYHQIENLLEVKADTVFDDNINLPDNYLKNEFQVEGNIKKITWVGPNPLGNNMVLNKSIQFKALHFQGVAKTWIPYFYERSHGKLAGFGVKAELKLKRLFRKLTGKKYK